MISELISTSIIKSVAKALLPWTKMYFYVKKKKTTFQSFGQFIRNKQNNISDKFSLQILGFITN